MDMTSSAVWDAAGWASFTAPASGGWTASWPSRCSEGAVTPSRSRLPGSGSRSGPLPACGTSTCVQVFDVGESQGLPFVALELLEGGSLEARNGGTPQPEDAAATPGCHPGPRHRLGASGRDRPPRPQAGQRPLHSRWRSQDHRLRAGQTPRRGRRADPFRARSWARPVSWPPSRPAAMPTRSDPPPTSIRSAPSSTRCCRGGHPSRAAQPLETLQQVVAVDPVPPSKLRPGLSRDLETICLKSSEQGARRAVSLGGATCRRPRPVSAGSTHRSPAGPHRRTALEMGEARTRVGLPRQSGRPDPAGFDRSWRPRLRRCPGSVRSERRASVGRFERPGASRECLPRTAVERGTRQFEPAPPRPRGRAGVGRPPRRC